MLLNSHNFLNAAADRIRAVRERLGLTQEDFARQLGISQSFMSLVEAEKRKPSVQLLYSLLIVFNVDLHWILTGQGKMFNQDQGLTVHVSQYIHFLFTGKVEIRV
ncbi:MAG: helix-turn-helix transcriptional regulator [Candidatus Aminicenantes bacterium]|nr:MAG: helix-turn-helix transcriptional regulator [Candidatus Aminicenantes bacterium]